MRLPGPSRPRGDRERSQLPGQRAPPDASASPRIFGRDVCREIAAVRRRDDASRSRLDTARHGIRAASVPTLPYLTGWQPCLAAVGLLPSPFRRLPPCPATLNLSRTGGLAARPGSCRTITRPERKPAEMGIVMIDVIVV